MEHIHTAECLEVDVCDYGDDGDGYVAFVTRTCKVTGDIWE